MDPKTVTRRWLNVRAVVPTSQNGRKIFSIHITNCSCIFFKLNSKSETQTQIFSEEGSEDLKNVLGLRHLKDNVRI